MLIGCGANEVINPKLIIDKTKLQRLTERYDTTFVLIWTNWCDSSKKECFNKYIPLAESLNKKPNFNVIIIAADETIPQRLIASHQASGIHSYFLSNPGGSSWFNRLRIKSFLNYCYPDQELTCASGFLFKTPIQFLVCDQKLEQDPQNISGVLALIVE